MVKFIVFSTGRISDPIRKTLYTPARLINVPAARPSSRVQRET